MQRDDSQQDAVKPVLKLANGKHVMSDGRVISVVQAPKPAAEMHREIASGRRASATLEKLHRRLGDLPDTPQKMNPIAAVMGYSSIGLNNEDIATALGATVEQIETIKQSEAYKSFVELFDQSTFDDAKREARHIIANASNKAARTMASALESDDENIRVVASREILKTAGVGLEQESFKMGGGLKIVIEKREKGEDKITVSLGEKNV